MANISCLIEPILDGIYMAKKCVYGEESQSLLLIFYFPNHYY